MQAIYDRLLGSLQVYHPVIEGEELTNGDADSKTKFLREKLNWALQEMAVLDLADCDQSKARKAWDKVFSTSFFTDKGTSQKADQRVTSAAIIKAETARNIAEQSVDRHGGGRYG